MSNPGHLFRLVEPNMGPPVLPVEKVFEGILQQRDALKVKMDAEGVKALSQEERVRIAMANILEAQLPARCKKKAAEIITRRVESTKLSDRFLCAVLPPYLGVKPTSRGVMRAVKGQMVAEFEDYVARAQDNDMQEKIAQVFANDIARAAILEKPLVVKKPLSLQKKGPVNG